MVSPASLCPSCAAAGRLAPVTIGDAGHSCHAVLHQADAFAVMPLLADASVDAIIADPPYGTTALEWDRKLSWPGFWAEARRILTPTGIVVMFSAQPFTTELINSNRDWFRYELIWEKTGATGFLNANRRPLTCHENILIFAPKLYSGVYNPQKTPGAPYKTKPGPAAPHYASTTRKIARENTGDRHPRSVLHFPSERSGEHPTQKPLELLRWLVRTYTLPGQLIVDPFMGSGTTGVAALLEGRRFLGVECEEHYFSIARSRLEVVSNAAKTQENGA